MRDINTLMPASYEASRNRFRDSLKTIQSLWPSAKLFTHTLEQANEKDLTQDWIIADALDKKEKLLLFTIGEHGLEAFFSAAIQQMFLNEFVPRLDPNTTGLTLVHAINPWGMKHIQRNNGNNVDINRNFVWSEEQLDAQINPEYQKIRDFLEPGGFVSGPISMHLSFISGVLRSLLTIGAKKLKSAVSLGQYAHPKGIYFGGNAIQEETRVMQELYSKLFSQYNRIVLLDMHTGYGPRYQMSVVNSVLEPRSSQELVQAFNYPNVVKTDADEFYAMRGDMIDYVYTLLQKENPNKHVYATTFEFGTYGDSFGSSLRSLRTSILSNQLRWYGAVNKKMEEWVKKEYADMFMPHEIKWSEKATADAYQAMEGILRAEGFIN